MTQTIKSLAIAVGIGVALGVATQIGQSLLPDALRPMANSISPWLAVAFGVGSINLRPTVAAVLAWVALLVAVVAYYALVWLRFGYGPSYASLVLWGSAAFAGGLIFGPSGWFWRNRSGWLSALPIGLLAAAFIADSVYVYSVVQPEEKPAAVLLVLAGALTPAILGRDREERAAGYISVLPALALAAAGYFVAPNLFGGGPV